MDEELERFCAEAYPRLVGALGLHCGDVHLAEELAQEALLRACRRWRTVRELDAPAGWAYRVGVNLANSHFRRRRAERRASSRLGVQPLTVSEEHESRLMVRAAVAQLGERQRSAVVLRYYLGLTSEQAAAHLDTTPEAVRALTHRALTVLRTYLHTDLDLEGGRHGG